MRIQPAALNWPFSIRGVRILALVAIDRTVHPTSHSARSIAPRQARSAARSSSRPLWTAFDSVSNRSLVPSNFGLSSNCSRAYSASARRSVARSHASFSAATASRILAARVLHHRFPPGLMTSLIQTSISANDIPGLLLTASAPAVSVILKVRPVLLRRKPSRLRERSIRSACVSWLTTCFPSSPFSLRASEPHAGHPHRTSHRHQRLHASDFKRAP
jgi:hypothetical protein